MTHLPIVGDDAAGVRALSTSLDTVARVGAAPLSDTVDLLDDLSADGKVDVDVLEQLTPPVREAHAAFQAAAADVAGPRQLRLRRPGEDPLRRVRRRGHRRQPGAAVRGEGHRGAARDGRRRRPARLPPRLPEQRRDPGHGRSPRLLGARPRRGRRAHHGAAGHRQRLPHAEDAGAATVRRARSRSTTTSSAPTTRTPASLPTSLAPQS